MDFEIGKRRDLNGILELYQQLNISDASSFTKKEGNKIWDTIGKNNADNNVWIKENI